MFYTTSRHMTFEQFIEIEVFERKNYKSNEIARWSEKYENLNLKSKVIWVTNTPHMAARYLMPVSKWNNCKDIYFASKEEFDVKSIKPEDGFLITESDDGEDGFLFVTNKY